MIIFTVRHDKRNKFYVICRGWYRVLLDWPIGTTSTWSKIHPGYILCFLEVNWEVNSECSWISYIYGAFVHIAVDCSHHYSYLQLRYIFLALMMIDGWFHLSLTGIGMHLTFCVLFQIAGLLDAQKLPFCRELFISSWKNVL